MNLIFSKANPILKKGYRNLLVDEDIPSIHQDYESKEICDRVEASWRVREKNRLRLIRCMFDVFGPRYLVACIFIFLSNCFALSTPFILLHIIRDLEKRTILSGVIHCSLIFGVKMMSTICLNEYIYRVMTTGLKVRVTVAGLVFRKAMRLSPTVRVSPGKITNMMYSDAFRLEMASWFANDIWSASLQVFVVSLCLIFLLKQYALIGISLLIGLVPLLAKLSTIQASFNKKRSSTTDDRVSFLQDMIEGVRVVKYYAWEAYFVRRIDSFRYAELSNIRKGGLIMSFNSVLTAVGTILASILTFSVYILCGNKLEPSIIFPVISLFGCLSWPLKCLPLAISLTVDGLVALRRVNEILEESEIEKTLKSGPDVEMCDSKNVIEVRNAVFTWGNAKKDDSKGEDVALDKPEKVEEELNTISVDHLDVKKGSLIAIVGTVGSGKSSLLAAFLGEMQRQSGSMSLATKNLAYCSQQAFIFNGTVRDNIIFGLPFDKKLYEQTISVCALESDLKQFPAGDLTEIGEKGANLSGGQKQRIGLARATYRRSEIILLDDPLSAVDAHVGKHIFKNCIKTAMSASTRLLVTHQLFLLSEVDHIVVMANGKISDQGSLSELKSRGFSNFVRVLETSLPDNASTEVSELENANASTPVLIRDEDQVLDSETSLIIMDEESSSGSLKKSVIWNYFMATGGWKVLISCILFQIIFQASRVVSDRWISKWPSSGDEYGPLNYSLVLIVLGFIQILSTLACNLFILYGTIRASNNIHDSALEGVLRAPISFFDSNPTGRIVNRFNKDQDVLDSQIPETISSVLYTFFACFTSLCTLVFIHWALLFIVFVTFTVFWILQVYFRASSRELKRVEASSRSPYTAHAGEALAGISTIRAYQMAEIFIEKNALLCNDVVKTSYMQIVIQRWLFFRLESTNNLIILITAVSCYLIFSNPTNAGLALNYTLSVTGVMNWCIRQISETENHLISSERLAHYADGLPKEAPVCIPEVDLTSDDILTSGNIEMDHLNIRYRSGLPLVLKDLTVSIKAGERVGIVGRTGAGKSSIMLALFRLIEAESGRIIIDGLDISTIGLKTLRSKLSIIPQDPVMFGESIRWNLDPSGQFDDQVIWNVIERSHLTKTISRQENGLSTILTNGGRSLSVGQRQLLCLARAMLRNSKILVLDEATANIDDATDILVQKSLRNEFSGCTILTIAHRIATVIDYDRILVLERGSVVEFDTPSALLSNSRSLFSSLVRESSTT